MNNDEIFKSRVEQYDKIEGIRVGDWVRFPDGTMNRVTHIWDVEPERQIQTGGNGCGFYLGDGYISYSGGLDPAVPESKFTLVPETKLGWVWFFKKNYRAAHNGIDYEMPFRVFECSADPWNQT